MTVCSLMYTGSIEFRTLPDAVFSVFRHSFLNDLDPPFLGAWESPQVKDVFVKA